MIFENESMKLGGGIVIDETSFSTFSNFTIKNNLIARHGGGIAFSHSKNLTIIDLLIKENISQ